MPDSLQQLRDHLKAMFQFDNNDLDFGLFRILKLKRKEVEAFIDEELERIVHEALADVSQKQAAFQLAEVAQFVKEKGGQEELALLSDVASNREQLTNFVNYKNPANKDTLLTALEAAATNGQSHDLADRIYNHVLRFFERYYRDGDFGYNDRSLATYQVDYPAEADYDGSDVLFHWKYKDSYYIKTANGFGSVPFTTDDGTRIEYRLEVGVDGASSVAQNSNKDDQQKHFALDRIAQDDDGAWHVVFRLAPASTSKVEIYTRMLADIFGVTDDVVKYLHKKPGTNEDPPGKPLFNDLDGKYDEVQNGQMKGMGKLRLPADKVLDHLAKRTEFQGLGGNKDGRTAALAKDETVQRLLAFDKALNAFYVGIDSDYFVHKNLKGFLTREQKRYIQNVIFSDLDAYLDFAVDNTAVVIARAFRHVTSSIIEFLSAVEEFQKNLFLMKKKVVETNYLISVGKIAEAVPDAEAQREILEQIVTNAAQVQEWKETFGVDPEDPVQLELEEEEPVHPLATHRTLPVDTRHFDGAFVDRLLAHFDDLDAEITGLLIDSENFQALRLLESRYRGQVKCIYIDPPYNTGGDGFLYKDRFRHSSWLSMMRGRIEAGVILMADDAALFSSIDDDEQARLKLVLDDVSGSRNFINAVIWQKKYAPANDAKWFSDDHDFLLVYTKDKEAWRPGRLPRTEKQNKAYSNPDNHERGDWKAGDYINNKSKEKRPNLWYPIIQPTTKEEIWPKPGTTWRYSPEKHDQNVKEHRVWWGEEGLNKVPAYKRFLSEVGGLVPRTIWPHKEAGHNQDGVRELQALFRQAPFASPKPIRLIERVLTVAPGSPIMDFFAGSGTTGHAVLKLNKEDGGQRKFILVEMGDYFERVLKERIRRVMYSLNWKDGKPVKDQIDGTLGIVKYQRLEQYEDVLNNLDLTGTKTLPDGVPMRYLYRPAEQRVRQSLDLGRPFDCAIQYGKDNTEGTVDVLETYCYLKGFPIRQRRRYDLGEKIYRVVRSGRHLVVLRNIDTGEDDTDALKTILADFDGIEVLHVNHDAEARHLEGLALHLRLIDHDAFDAGTTWS